MNKSLEVTIEVAVAMLLLALIITFVQNALYGEKTCQGTPPILNDGVFMGPSTYTAATNQTKWIYERTATITTPCKWKCNAGYTKNENTCTGTD
jgi:hypothetical protein